MWFVLLIHPNSINLTHNGSASVSVMVKCLVLVKINGNSPRKLLNRIRENSEMNINVLPLISYLERIFSWASMVFIIRYSNMIQGYGRRNPSR
jgi:hypothetical protein